LIATRATSTARSTRRIGTTAAHEDLTGRDFDGKWKIAKNTAAAVYVHLLGTHGIGVFYVNSRRWPDLRPPAIGWHSIERQDDWRSQRTGCILKTSAERFEIGNPSYISAYILDNA
jgi:hypothetical protein